MCTCVPVQLSKGHFIESIIELSLCKYLLINNTTFSGWASFIGDVISFMVTPDRTKGFLLEEAQDFSVVGGFIE